MRSLLLVCGLACLTGCSGGQDVIPITTAPVNGKVTYQGKPLEDFRVFMYLKEGNQAQEPSTGRVDKDGNFVMGVRAADDGAMVGTNLVWFVYDPPAPPSEPGHEVSWTPPPPKVKVPQNLQDMEKSGITLEVPAGGVKDHVFELK